MRTLVYPMPALGLCGADWPQFRGPDGSGLCPSCGEMPTRRRQEVLSGGGGGSVFLTGAEGDDLITMCVSRTTGRVEWRRSLRAARREARNPLNHRAALTAVTDGKSVYF